MDTPKHQHLKENIVKHTKNLEKWLAYSSLKDSGNEEEEKCPSSEANDYQQNQRLDCKCR